MASEIDRLQQRADSLNLQGRTAEAIDAYRAVLKKNPARADCWYNLGYLLRRVEDFDGALRAYEEALARGAAGPEEIRLNRAVIYADDLRDDAAAERELAAALSIAPGYAPALLNLGNLQEERGDREAAVACYDRLLALGGRDDLHAEALARLAHLRAPAGRDDPMLARLRATAADGTGLGSETRANLLFALGRALDALGAYDEAFRAFQQANDQARRTGRAYDRQACEALIDAIIAAFPMAEEASPRTSAEKAAPLFVCGMFRSGSTLCEQALAGHQKVTAGGELDLLPRLAAKPLAPFPASVATMPAAAFEAHAADYLARLARLFPDAPRGGYVTDKRPDNFLFIGLIKKLFPDARIVHTVRHPLDNGLSVYFQHLAQDAMRYASDLGDIGHYFGQYRRLMAHWKALYPDSIHDFDYDAFVREPRETLEALLAFCRLEWSEDCLAFHKRDNTVKTASYWQVRRPLYGDASGRWRHYEPRLSPLIETLAEAGVDMPGA